MVCKNHSETINSLCGSRAVLCNDFGPFGMGVSQKQEQRSEERPSENHVDSLKGLIEPFPRAKRCSSRLFLLQLAAGAFVHCFLDVLFDSWPPDITPG